MKARRTRFWIESGAAALAGVLAVLTLAWPEWIEATLRVSPDGGDGSLEWLIVVVLALVSVTLGLVARAEARRPVPST